MTEPANPVRLEDVIKVVRDLERTPFKITADWSFRQDDIKGAWAEERGLGRLRVAAMTPLSLMEHGLNRALGAAGTLALKPVLSSHLKALEGTEEAAPYGHELAKAVVAKMIASLRPAGTNVRLASLANYHRDYCGTGLLCEETDGTQVFHYGTVYDGELWPPFMLTFPTAEEFVDWLAAQSDLSLSGAVGEPPLRDWRMAGNQRLSRGRLLAYVDG